MQPNPKLQPLDPNISARTALLGAVASYLASPRLHLDPNLAALLGTMAGALYDYVAYRVKFAWHSSKAVAPTDSQPAPLPQ